MDIYHIWCNLKPGAKDLDFCDKVDAYLGHLADQEMIQGHRITRRKLGLGPPEFPEFHIMVEVTDLAQLDTAFNHVATRAGLVEGFHQAVNSLATDLKFSLYRDFPDPVRETGEEKF
jgi:hypothetical protein